MKGTALAYSVYDEPYDRARGDTDILVAAQDHERACGALRSLGFRRAIGVTAEAVSQQASFVLEHPVGLEHVIDLHWEIDNSPLLARLFSHEELLKRGISLPRISPSALGLGSVDALLIACMHRQKHLQIPYYVDGVCGLSDDRLIWIYDVDLLAKGLSSVEWKTLCERAREKGLAAVVLDGLHVAQQTLGTKVSKSVLEPLRNSKAGEAPAKYMKSSWFYREWMDMSARQGFDQKLRYILEVMFPPADYMRLRFEGTKLGWLPWLYARRAFGGIAKRISNFGSAAQ